MHRFRGGRTDEGAVGGTMCLTVSEGILHKATEIRIRVQHSEKECRGGEFVVSERKK